MNLFLAVLAAGWLGAAAAEPGPPPPLQLTITLDRASYFEHEQIIVEWTLTNTGPADTVSFLFAPLAPLRWRQLPGYGT